MILNKVDIKTSGESLSINDLRDLYFSGQPLTEEQQLALANFDKYRLAQLEEVKNSPSFNEVYFQIQAMANLADFREFLRK